MIRVRDEVAAALGALFLRADKTDLGQPIEYLFEQHGQFETGQVRPETEVTAVRTERLMLVGVTGDVELVRSRTEHVLVAVAREVQQQGAVASQDRLTADLNVDGGGAVHVSHRGHPPQHLLDRTGQQ